MTLVTIDLGDVAGGHDPDDHVVIRAEAFRESHGGGVTSTAEVKIPLVDGVGQAEVEPGPVVVAFRCQAVADTREKRGVVPESGPVGVEDVIAGAFEYTPPVVNRSLDLIESAQDEALGRVESAVDVEVRNALNEGMFPIREDIDKKADILHTHSVTDVDGIDNYISTAIASVADSVISGIIIRETPPGSGLYEVGGQSISITETAPESGLYKIGAIL